jgi:hypothetical protein
LGLKRHKNIPLQFDKILFHNFIENLFKYFLLKAIYLDLPSSQISNQTSTSYLACTWLVLGEGRAPNLGERTGWLMGMCGGSIRRGGWRPLQLLFKLFKLLNFGNLIRGLTNPAWPLCAEGVAGSGRKLQKRLAAF